MSFASGVSVWFTSIELIEASFEGVPVGGSKGVNVEVAVWPTASVTRYVTAVFVPADAAGSASNTGTPVIRSIDHVPSPEMTNVSLHTESDGSTRHGPSPAPVRSPVPVASAEFPTTFVKATEAPCSTLFCCGLAAGAAGGLTVGVIVAVSTAPNESVTWYVGGDATVPRNVGTGVNVTAPVVVFTV